MALFGLWHHSTVMMWDGPALFGLWHHNDIMWDGRLCSTITVWSRSETALFDLWSNVNWSTLLCTWNTGLILALSDPWNDTLVGPGWPEKETAALLFEKWHDCWPRKTSVMLHFWSRTNGFLVNWVCPGQHQKLGKPPNKYSAECFTPSIQVVVDVCRLAVLAVCVVPIVIWCNKSVNGSSLFGRRRRRRIHIP